MIFRKKPSNISIKLDDLIRGTKKQSVENPEHTKEDIDRIYEKLDTINENSLDFPNKEQNKTEQLIDEIKKLEKPIIKPFIDFNEGNLFYPILSKIGEVQSNIKLLDSLVEKGVLEKNLYEKLTVCPMHPDSLGATIHLYCPSCNSHDVEKLNLFEHKKCGYIADSNKFHFSNDENHCPSCNKEIKNFEKEIKVPAMWYQCYSCHEKFDNVIIRLYCRNYDHDFDTNAAKFFPTFSYSLKSEESFETPESSNLIDVLSSLLHVHNFSVHKNYSLTGRSGNIHTIPFYAKNDITGKSILFFIKNKADIIDESDLNPILVAILDIGQKNIFFLTNNTVKERAYNIAKAYGVTIISKSDVDSVTSEVQRYLTDEFGEGK
ncbi:MAG: hypothetical protein R3327_05540 [Nitrosopumilaceae archaeon]|nr:hypothetical protein [Nitrosopumilaceae archaeon]